MPEESPTISIFIQTATHKMNISDEDFFFLIS